MNQEREQILQQLGDLIDNGGDSDAVYRVLRKALAMRPKPLELRDVEVLLRRLSEAAIPEMSVSFASYDEPRYRSALRMQIGDLRMPGATGGILDAWPGMPDDVDVASALLYLESWASARSGQDIRRAELPFPLSDR